MLLPTDVWVAALIRRAELGGAFATVARRGDARAGGVLVKVFDTAARQATLYTEAFGPDGARLWIRPVEPGPEGEIDVFAARQLTYDPDLWVVEIEDREGRHFLTEAVAPEG